MNEPHKQIWAVSYSGGLGSFAAAHRIRYEWGIPADQIKLVFTDTLIEDEDLYRFLDESAAALGLELIKLTDGRTPWDVFKDEKFQGNTRKAPCSKILKRNQMMKWLKTQPADTIIVLGIDIEEEHRLARAKKNNANNLVIAPLCHKTPRYMPHGERLKLLDAYGLRIPRLYEMGFPHNNCGGFCVRAGLSQFALLKRLMPERYEWHKEQQEKLMVDVPNVKPFLRQKRNKVMNYLTLAEYEEYLKDNEPPQFEFGGCGCFIDDEEKSENPIDTE